MKSYFDSNTDSPLTEAFRHWTDTGKLDCFDMGVLDEYESCCWSILDRPAYYGDPAVEDFRDAITIELANRDFA